jgi:hypothetical protein
MLAWSLWHIGLIKIGNSILLDQDSVLSPIGGIDRINFGDGAEQPRSVRPAKCGVNKMTGRDNMKHADLDGRSS